MRNNIYKIDIVKSLQIVPEIGAVVCAYANYKLMDKLGDTTMNGYKVRICEIIYNI
ncbi:MAG: EcsC family protein [Clostridium sp.]